MSRWFTYRGRVDHDSGHPWGVVDGDTIDVVVDLGFGAHRHIRLRLKDIDTAEVYGPNSADEQKAGNEQAAFVLDWLEQSTTPADYPEWPLAITTEKTGKYGRYVAEIVRRNDGASLTADLAAEWPEVAYDQ